MNINHFKLLNKKLTVVVAGLLWLAAAGLAGAAEISGRYRIQGLPEGEYVLRAWHIFGGADQKTVRVGNQPLMVDFTLRSTQSIQEIMEHSDKSGRGYSNSDSY